MNILQRSTLVVAISAAASIGLWSACGSDSPAPVADVVGSGGNGGASGGGAGSETGGGGSGEQIDASATAGAAGTAGGGNESDAPADVAMTPVCVEKAACTNGPDPGLCTAGACAGCIDVTGDPACVAAYGAGHLCIGSACIRAQCRVAADCGDAGKTCVESTCVSTACHNDGECSDVAKPVCDLPSGNCVTAAAACTAKAAGDVCAGPASKHLCCGASLSCRAIDCCTDAQCPVGQTCSAQGTCASAACATVSGIGPYYVDAGDPGTNGRTGSTACPFKSITQALAFVTNLANPQNAAFNVTIIVRSAISEANEGVGAFPIYVASRIVIQGETDTARPVVTVPDGATGFVFNYPKPAASIAFGGITQLSITQTTAVTDDTKQGYGVQISGTHPNVGEALDSSLNVDISKLTIQKFRNGIRVDTGGYAGIGGGMTVTGNYLGVNVNNGYVRAVGSAASPSHFDDNFHSGMYAGGATILDVQGAASVADGGATGRFITADRNNFGVRFESVGMIPTGLTSQLLNVQMSNNFKLQPDATTNGAGLYLYAGGNPIKVRGSVLTNNHTAVYVASDSAATSPGGPNDLSPLDLGGQNAFFSDANTLLCVGIPSVPAAALKLNAANNTWNGYDCSTAKLLDAGVSNINLKTATNCTGKRDIGGMSLVHTQGWVVVTNCALTATP